MQSTFTDGEREMNSKQNMRRRALCMAMGACLASIAAAPVFAQSVTGAVAGRAEAGAQVPISNPATGLTRSATVSADGGYRTGQMPPGTYHLTSGSGELGRAACRTSGYQ